MPHGIGRSSKRIDGSGATTVAAADVAIGAGWGTTGTKTVTSGSTENRGQVVVTASGASFAQATATVVITFPGGTRPTAPPVAFVSTTNDNSIDTGHCTFSTSTTALTITFSLLPVDTKIYKINYLLPD